VVRSEKVKGTLQAVYENVEFVLGTLEDTDGMRELAAQADIVVCKTHHPCLKPRHRRANAPKTCK
jgi:hypothetical protein